MREFAVAIIFTAIVTVGVLFLPYSIDKSPPPQPVAVQQVAPETARSPVGPAQGTAPPEHRHVQNVAQPVAAAGGDREQGRQVYRKCQACHSLEVGRNGVGPTLAAILGKKAASEPGYAYSPALRDSGLTWDIPTIDQYLLGPQKCPATKCRSPASRPRTSAGM
jgi:nitrite reductase (NO-forming)